MPDIRFADMEALSPETVAVLHAQGLHRATPVQAATIPLFSKNTDVSVDSQTGQPAVLSVWSLSGQTLVVLTY